MPKEQHIRIVEEGNRVTLVCDDYELFDWMENLFAEEHDIEIDHVIMTDAQQEYKILFSRSVEFQIVRTIIDGLDQVEIERLYLLKNSAPGNR